MIIVYALFEITYSRKRLVAVFSRRDMAVKFANAANVEGWHIEEVSYSQVQW
jgi:hypothetical protein